MWTKHIFVIWFCIRIKGEVSHELNWCKHHAPHPHSVVFLLAVRRRFLCCCLVLPYVACVLSLFVSHLAFILVPQESFASLFLHFLGIFAYI